MLVLSRKVGEAICIDDNITVTVVHLTNGRVRIGIDAPQSVPIIRGELEQWKTDCANPCEPRSKTVELPGAQNVRFGA